MTVVQLRYKLQELIQVADFDLLQKIDAIVSNYKVKNESHLSENQKIELDKRRVTYVSGDEINYNLDEVREMFSEKYGL